MAKGKYTPGGFHLTLKKARQLTIQEFGTSKGLKLQSGQKESFFEMTIGNLTVEINPDKSGYIRLSVRMSANPNACIQFHDRETLERDFEAEDRYQREERQEFFENWVGSNGPEACKEAIDRIADAG